MKYSQQIPLYLIDIDGFELMSFEEFWLILIKCDHPIEHLFHLLLRDFYEH